MRYTIQQLRKMKMPFEVEEDIDFSNELNGFEDIISSNKAHVKEKINSISNDTFEVSMKISIELSICCNITLESLPLVINTESIEIYSTDPLVLENSDVIPIEGQTLDTKDAILTNILCNKPMTSTKPGASFESVSEEEELEDKINPAFAGLKDLLK